MRAMKQKPGLVWENAEPGRWRHTLTEKSELATEDWTWFSVRSNSSRFAVINSGASSRHAGPKVANYAIQLRLIQKDPDSNAPQRTGDLSP